MTITESYFGFYVEQLVTAVFLLNPGGDGKIGSMLQCAAMCEATVNCGGFRWNTNEVSISIIHINIY